MHNLLKKKHDEMENRSFIFYAGRHTSFVSLPLPFSISNISSSPDDQGAEKGFAVSSTPHLPEIMKLLRYVISSKAPLDSSWTSSQALPSNTHP